MWRKESFLGRFVGGRGKQGQVPQDKVRINNRIRVPQVRLIDEKGEQLGVYNTDEALKLAQSRGLDLVEVSAEAKPPVCKILDYGKLKYTKKKKEQEAKKKASTVTLKEIQFRIRIEQHDFDVKLRRIEEFIKRGDKVKLSILFRGREMAFAKQQGQEMMARILDVVKEYAMSENIPKLEGRRMLMVLAPLRKTQASGGAAKPKEKAAPKSTAEAE